MPNYKLIYFDGRGRAEVCRYLFKMNDVEFVDERISGTWDKEKPNTPFGQLPVLEVDGVKYCQSAAIERFVAKQHGLYGDNEMEQFKTDMVIGCLEDMLQAMVKTNQGSDEEKENKKKELATEKLPKMLTDLEKFINTDGYFVNKRLMWPDITAAHLITFVDVLGLDMKLSEYKKLSTIKERVESHPKIAAWIKIRPQTKF